MKPKAYLRLLTDKRPKPTEETIKRTCGFIEMELVEIQFLSLV